MSGRYPRVIVAAAALAATAGACSKNEPSETSDGSAEGPEALPMDAADASPTAAAPGNPANFVSFERDVYSELGTACPGSSCAHATVVSRSNVTERLNGTLTCSASASPSDTAVVAELATRPDVVNTLADPNLCKGDSGPPTFEAMIVTLADGRTIGNSYSSGCPGAAFDQLRAAMNQLDQKYCNPSIDGGSADGP